MTAPARVTASCFAAAAFAVALLAGLRAGVPAAELLGRATTCLVVCYLGGLLIGTAGGRAIRDALEAHERNNPVPDAEPSDGANTEQGEQPYAEPTAA